MEEGNPAIRDVFGKLGDLQEAQLHIQHQFLEQSLRCRTSFKDILKQEQALDQVKAPRTHVDEGHHSLHKSERPRCGSISTNSMPRLGAH